MRVRFWGTRGSLPVSLTAEDIKNKIVDALLAAAGRNLNTRAEVEAFVERDLPLALSHTYGGNSSCVELDIGTEEYVLCDLGTGVRPFGLHVLARKGPRTRCTFHVFLSHLHWDHIMGFPFFPHVYIPGNRIVIYGCHPGHAGDLGQEPAAGRGPKWGVSLSPPACLWGTPDGCAPPAARARGGPWQTGTPRGSPRLPWW